MTEYQLAQVNIATAKYPLTDPRMAGFMNALDDINALAEAAPGFVWRCTASNGNATSLRVFDNDRIIYNSSVWTNLEHLRNYVFRTQHVRFLKRRAEWFESTPNYSALWWVEHGHTPTIDETKRALDHIAKNGPTPRAFSFAHPIDTPHHRLNTGSGTEWEKRIGYCRAVRVGNQVEVAGTTSVDERGNVVGIGDPTAQTRYILAKIERALIQSGATMAAVIRTRMFVTNIAHWQAVGDAHGEFFRDILPVATMVQVSALIDQKLLVEIEATAIIQ